MHLDVLPRKHIYYMMMRGTIYAIIPTDEVVHNCHVIQGTLSSEAHISPLHKSMSKITISKKGRYMSKLKTRSSDSLDT